MMDEYIDIAACEYCGCELRYCFNSIRRHSQPESQKHKQGNIPMCNDCIHALYLKGDLALDAHTSTWQFKEDILKKMGPSI